MAANNQSNPLSCGGCSAPKVCRDSKSTTVWLNDLPVCCWRLRITWSTGSGILRMVYCILLMHTVYTMYAFMYRPTSDIITLPRTYNKECLVHPNIFSTLVLIISLYALWIAYRAEYHQQYNSMAYYFLHARSVSPWSKHRPEHISRLVLLYFLYQQRRLGNIQLMAFSPSTRNHWFLTPQGRKCFNELLAA